MSRRRVVCVCVCGNERQREITVEHSTHLSPTFLTRPPLPSVASFLPPILLPLSRHGLHSVSEPRRKCRGRTGKWTWRASKHSLTPSADKSPIANPLKSIQPQEEKSRVLGFSSSV